MAVFCEFISLIIRRDSIDKYFPGGWIRFVSELPNQSMATDGEVVRVGFMNPIDSSIYLDFLTDEGLQFMESSGREIDDIIDLDQFNYALDQSSWLMVGDRIFDEQKYFCCWLKGSSIETLANHLNVKRMFMIPYSMTPHEFVNRYAFVRSENGLDIYTDIYTNSERDFEFYMPMGVSIEEYYKKYRERRKKIKGIYEVRKERIEKPKKADKAKQIAKEKRAEEKKLVEQKKEQERKMVAEKKAEDELYAKVTKILKKKTLDRTNPAVIMEMLIKHALKTDNEKDLDLIVRFWELNYGLGYFEIYDNGDTYSIFVDPIETIRLMKFEWEDYWEVDPSLLSEEERFKIFSDRIEGAIESEYGEGGVLITKQFGGCILTANQSDPREGLDYFDIGWYKDIKNKRLQDIEIIESDDNGERNFTEEELKDYFNETYYKSDILDDLLKALFAKEGVEAASAKFNSNLLDFLGDENDDEWMSFTLVDNIVETFKNFLLENSDDKSYDKAKLSIRYTNDEEAIIIKEHYGFYITADWDPFNFCSAFQVFNTKLSMHEYYKSKGIVLFKSLRGYPSLNYSDEELKKIYVKCAKKLL